MESQLKMCRVCKDNESDGELIPIYEKNNKIAMGIFQISGVKILEFNRFEIPALICLKCIKDLSRAIKFRHKCRESDKFFKKSAFAVEHLVYSQCDYEEAASGSQSAVKEGNDLNGIKDEPREIFSLFETIDTILEEQIEAPEESNSLAGVRSKIHKDDSCSTSSDLDSDYEEYKKRRKASKRSTDTNEFDMGTDSLSQCKLCCRSFTSMHSLKDHMRAIHQKLEESDMFKCPHCNRLFKMKYYLNRHIKSFHQKLERKKAKGLKPNKPKTEGDEIFNQKLVGLNCPYCNKFLTSKHSLNDHIRVRHEFINYSERFLCDICGKDFPLKYYLLRHIRASHLKTLSYKKKNDDHLPCSICGKILKSKGNLSTHEKTHRILSPDEYWYCDICGNKFKGRGEMTVHIKKRHLFKIRYPCELCPGKSWRTLFQLQRHVKVFHHNIREFKCEWCGKEFGEKNKLVCHVRIHTGEQPFKCNFDGCSRAFTHQTDLRRHVWGHTGERPYKCQNQACGKGFMKKSELTAHASRCHSIRPNMPLSYQYQMI